MTDEKPEGSRFQRFRDLGESVTDVAKAVTGHSAVEDIAEFTDAYTEVLTGLYEDLEALHRQVNEISTECSQIKAEIHAQTAKLRRSVQILTMTAAGAVLTGGVAVILALTI